MKALVIHDPPLPGPLNMAVDACLAAMAGSGEIDLALRTYTWEPHTVSLGRLQRGCGDLDAEKLRRDGFGLVRRPTGGRAVWHGRELTYSVAASSRHPLYTGGIRDSLGTVASMLVTALGGLGVPAAANPSAPGGGFGRGPCFTTHGALEIMTGDGRKLVGSAQARTRDSFLEHGSILFDNDQPKILDYTLGMTPDLAEAMRKRLAEGAGTVREFLPGADPDDLVPLIRDAFARWCGWSGVPTDHTCLDRRLLDSLAEGFVL